jgi:hypothetical protein
MKQVMIFLRLSIIFLLLTKVSFAVTDSSSLSADLRSIPANANEEISYSFEIRNQFSEPQTFHLHLTPQGELACTTSLVDTLVTIEPQGLYKGKVKVLLSDRLPVGGQESCVLTVLNPEHKSTESLEFISVRSKKHPFLLVTNEILEETKAKIEKYDWAKQNFDNMLASAKAFKIPERKIAPIIKYSKVTGYALTYINSSAVDAFEMVLAWKLSGDNMLRDKAVQFIKEVCDPDSGYISVGAIERNVPVKEGNFFMYLAATFDVLYNEPVWSDTDYENIHATFRFYLNKYKDHMSATGIMNHEASVNAGAIVVALFMQDMAMVEHLTNSPGGMVDQISRGTMPDGWWFESAPGYCYLVVNKYTMVAQAYENYGWDLYHSRFPFKHKSKEHQARANVKDGYVGMKFDVWGPTGKNTIGLKDMYTAFVPLMDEKACLLANNDAGITPPDRFYEMAYRKFRKDEIAWVLNHSERDSWEALVYGVPELPKIDDPRTTSAYSSNVGLVALRSQKKDKTADEQIQTYLKYGTHGGWHGHFDRASLVALDRNGHNYFGTEMCWFGYNHAGYKECVQTSATHNMVVVDELQQEAVPSEQLLFHDGKMMQVSVVQTIARWRKIPTSNPDLFPPWDDKQFEPDFKPVLQRRMAIVTDDYIVIADYIKSSQKHTYDWLIHPIGLKEMVGLKKMGGILDSVSKQFDSPYKYFTDGQWYKMKEGSKLQFDDNGAKLDIHTIWPRKADVLIANYPRGGKQKEMRNNPDRRTCAVRSMADEMMFVHVLEPYKGKSMIEKIESNTSGQLEVFLTDGRKQEISISNFNGNGEDIRVAISEQTDNNETIKEDCGN